MKRLIRVHWLALHPTKVLSIVLGIALTLAGVDVAGRWAGVAAAAQSAAVRYFAIPEALLDEGRFDLLALLIVWMCAIWAVIGGAATRRMSLDLLGGPREHYLRSLHYCLKWSLVFPSLLAVGCFFFILLGRRYPWLLLALLPTWLYAGLYYGALTLEDISLADARRRIHRSLHRYGHALRVQAQYLVSFAFSTGVVYAVALAYTIAVLLLLGRREPAELLGPYSALEIALAAPVLTYAVGYTTSNLKSLQVLLYHELFSAKC